MSESGFSEGVAIRAESTVDNLRRRRDTAQKTARDLRRSGDSRWKGYSYAAAMMTIVILHLIFPAQAKEFYGDVLESIESARGS